MNLPESSTLSVIVPAYNEERTIAALLERVLSVQTELLDSLNANLHIMVIDDGSTDRTVAKVKEFVKARKTAPIKLLTKPNGGKGSAVRLGLQSATGDFVIIQDADLEYSPGDYPKLLEPIVQGKADVTYGSRFIGKPPFSRARWAIPLHFIGNKALSIATSLIYGTYITDMETCYKCFRRGVIDGLSLESDDFAIEAEITAKLLKKKARLIEIPIDYSARSFAEGKKINWKDGFKAFVALVKYRFR